MKVIQSVRLSSLCVCGALVVSLHALPQVQIKGVRYGSTHNHQTHTTTPAEEEARTAPYNEKYMTQRLDHFDKQSKDIFQQRYFVNPDYFHHKGDDDIVFLCVGGEGPPLDETVVSTSVHCSDAVELAKQVGALVVALEHRYYGKSLPFGERWVTSELQWLSSQQALADLATFHEFISEEFGLSDNAKWVTWGGSYPGMLAGWARLKYPHLFMAAVSSSSPLQAVLNFEEYNHAVRDSMADEVVGGSAACAQAVETGHAAIGVMLQTEEGIAALVDRFELCGPEVLTSAIGQKVFAGDGVVGLPVQENDPSCTEELCNIKKICDVMTDESIGCEVKRLAFLRKAQRRQAERASDLFNGEAKGAKGMRGGSGMLPKEVEEGCEDLQSRVDEAVAYPTDVYNPDRAWLYQTCSEFGFYQPCEEEGCPYTRGLHTLQDDLDMCWNAFGISAEEAVSAVAFSNSYYGGRAICTSNTYFPNGDIDPWSREGVLTTPCARGGKGDSLSVSSSSGVSVKVLNVRGASHHFWTHTPLPTDAQEVVAARNEIWAAVKSWLREEEEKEVEVEVE